MSELSFEQRFQPAKGLLGAVFGKSIPRITPLALSFIEKYDIRERESTSIQFVIPAYLSYRAMFNDANEVLRAVSGRPCISTGFLQRDGHLFNFSSSRSYDHKIAIQLQVPNSENRTLEEMQARKWCDASFEDVMTGMAFNMILFGDIYRHFESIRTSNGTLIYDTRSTGTDWLGWHQTNHFDQNRYSEVYASQLINVIE